MICLLLMAFLPSRSGAQSVFDQREQQLVRGLRERGLEDLAEKRCLQILARQDLSLTDFSSIASERIRIQTSQALTAEDRQTHWQKVDQIAADFSRSHPNHPQAVLVSLQQALAHVSFARVLQQEIEAKLESPQSREQGLKRLALARTILDQTRTNAIEIMKSQANQNLTPDMMTGVQLRTLVTNVEYQLAVVNLSSARLTDTGSESGKLNRLDFLGRVPEQLAAVRTAVARSKPLWWKTWIREAACRRMLGELKVAGRILQSLDDDQRPGSVDDMLLLEQIALAIAIDDRDDMQALAGTAIKKRHDAETEIALIRLLVKSGQPEPAARLAGQVRSSHGRWWARRADIALLSGAGNASSNQGASADTALLFAAAEKAEQNGDLAVAAGGFLAVAKSQLSAGDPSSGLMSTVRAAVVLEKLGKHEEAASTLLGPARKHPGEKLADSMHLRGCWNLSQAKSDRFAEELVSHIRQWPDAESANQARQWLASKQIVREQFAKAFETLAATDSHSKHFPAAVKLARFAAGKQLAALQTRGLSARSRARNLLRKWEQVLASCPEVNKPLVAVAMVELGVGSLREDAQRLGKQLKSFLPLPAAQSNAELLYLCACFSEAGEADALIAQAEATKFDAGSMRQLLELLEGGENSRKFARIRLAIAEQALARTKEAAGTREAKFRDRFLFSKAAALEEMGKSAEALEIFRQLAAADPKNLKASLRTARLLSGERALTAWRAIAAGTASHTPAWFEAKYNVAALLLESGKNDQAAKMLKYIKAVPPGWEKSDFKSKFESLLREAGR